jgi:hypothetical protein
MQGKVDFVADEPVNDHFLIKVAFIKPKVIGEFEVKT